METNKIVKEQMVTTADVAVPQLPLRFLLRRSLKIKRKGETKKDARNNGRV